MPSSDLKKRLHWRPLCKVRLVAHSEGSNLSIQWQRAQFALAKVWPRCALGISFSTESDNCPTRNSYSKLANV